MVGGRTGRRTDGRKESSHSRLPSAVHAAVGVFELHVHYLKMPGDISRSLRSTARPANRYMMTQL